MEKYVKEETINVNQEPAMKLEYINVEHESVDGNPDHVKVYRERVLYDKKAYWIGRRLQDIVFSAIALMVATGVSAPFITVCTKAASSPKAASALSTASLAWCLSAGV